jgi:DNA repair protein RecN (Recombination protein N)
LLTGLSIRDVVLIEKLDLVFGPGLTVLTGETGAGKSILLDSLGLALGARADAGLVRQGAAQAGVSARFLPPPDHPVHTLLDELGLPREDEIVLRRSVEKTGRSRAWVNDAPVGAGALKQLGLLLVEVQGQHDQMGLADPSGHVGLLDSYGVSADLLAGLGGSHRAWRAAEERLAGARAGIAAARREEDFLRHAVSELDTLAPEDGEETRLAEIRLRLQQGEKRAEAIEAALHELAPRDRRSHPPAAALRATCRVLERLKPSAAEAENPELSVVAPILAAIERAEEAIAEAETMLSRLASDADADPRLLEQTEERLFALRAASRKHGVPVAALAALLADLRARLAALDHGEAEIDAMVAAVAAARASYAAAAGRVSEARRKAGARLEKAVAAELPPLRLEKARFFARVDSLPEAEWGAHGADQVRFLISTNPGQSPGALGKVASGGELSRLMLALKVAFSAGGSVPTLVFDEVDSGIGGATAAAVGDRLARVAEGVQVLVVTHSPQVAARGTAHLVVSKAERRGRTETSVLALEPGARREEIARMLAGEVVTEAARAAAASLLHAG